MQQLRIGVIGAGGRGTIASYAHRPADGTIVTACCATDPAALERSRELYGEQVFITADYRALLDQPLDAVFVCTPDYLHEQHAIAALERGRAVYLEKPMAITVEGCDRILRAAMEARARLYVGHNMRHMEFVRQMKRLIDQGAIGQVKTAWCRHFVGHGGDFYFKDWHAERRNTTSMLLQKASHDIDVLHWLCGGYTRRVNALGGLTLYDQIADRHTPSERGDAMPSLEHWPPLSNHGMNPVIDIEDVSMMQMQLDNGVFACYQQCHYTPDYWRNYTVIGTLGRIENVGNSEPGTVINLWNTRRWEFGPPDEVFAAGSSSEAHGGADPRIVAEFLAFARDGGPTTTSPLGARASVATGCLATQSLRSGGAPHEVPPVDAQVRAYFEAGQA
jgi:predicted dehydrogenase